MQTQPGGQMNLKYPNCQSQELSLRWYLFICFTSLLSLVSDEELQFWEKTYCKSGLSIVIT